MGASSLRQTRSRIAVEVPAILAPLHTADDLVDPPPAGAMNAPPHDDDRVPGTGYVVHFDPA